MVRATTLAAEASEAVVVRRASGADARALAAEGARLVAAAHPGVVQVASSTGTAEEWELRLVHGGRPLEVVGPLSVERVAGIVAGVAATLADLHDMGIVHGHLDASHVLVGSHGRPVLCGFGPPDRVTGGPADDVAALGALIVELLAGQDDLEPIPERRWRPRPSWTGWTRRSLLTIADQACAEPPTRRPTARRLAAAISEAVPDAVVGAVAAPAPVAPGVGEPHGDPLADLRRTAQHGDGPSRPPLAALAVTALGIVVLAVAGLRAGDGSEPSEPSKSERPAVSEASSSEEEHGSDGIVAAPCVVATSAEQAGSGCVEPVEVRGTTVIAGTHRYEVGEPDDVVVLGDWDCDGGATPALLRPRTGEVFVFTEWASGGDVVVVRPLDVVDGGVDIVARTVQRPDQNPPHACSRLVVRRSDGTTVEASLEATS